MREKDISYKESYRLAERMVLDFPDTMVEELFEKGMRDNITEEYYKKGKSALRKYNLNLTDETELKDILKRALESSMDEHLFNKGM